MGKSHNLRMAKLRAKKKADKVLAIEKAQAKEAEYIKRNSENGGIKYPIPEQRASA